MFINNFNPIAFQIISFEIRWYSLAYIAGIVIGWFLCKKILIKKSDIYEKFDDYVTFLIIGIIIGGRLGYVLFYNFNFYINNILDIFKIWEGGVKILAIHYFGKWSEYEFCDAPHAAWAPEVEKVGLTNQEQERAFTLFKQLVADTEEINGFPITDNRHELYFQPEFRGLLIRILNSKIYNEV